MAESIKERLKFSEDGCLILKTSPAEFLTLSRYSDDFPTYLTIFPMGADSVAFSLEGVVIFCEDLRELRELQKKMAAEEIQQILEPPSEKPA